MVIISTNSSNPQTRDLTNETETKVLITGATSRYCLYRGEHTILICNFVAKAGSDHYRHYHNKIFQKNATLPRPEFHFHRNQLPPLLCCGKTNNTILVPGQG
jgi:hypothetical protein